MYNKTSDCGGICAATAEAMASSWNDIACFGDGNYMVKYQQDFAINSGALPLQDPCRSTIETTRSLWKSWFYLGLGCRKIPIDCFRVLGLWGKCPPWVSFWEILVYIYASFGENHGKIWTTRSTSATGDWTRPIPFIRLEGRTPQSLVTRFYFELCGENVKLWVLPITYFVGTRDSFSYKQCYEYT